MIYICISIESVVNMIGTIFKVRVNGVNTLTAPDMYMEFLNQAFLSQQQARKTSPAPEAGSTKSTTARPCK